MKTNIRNKKGSISINVVIFLSVMLPVFFFFCVDIYLLISASDRFQSFNDHIASASIMGLNEDKYRRGILEIDEFYATEIAENMLKKSYRLDDDLLPLENSLVKETPLMKIYPINNVPVGGIQFVTDEGYSVNVKNTSIIVYTECKPKGLLFSGSVVLKSISVYQTQFKNSGTNLVVPSTNIASDVTFYLENVVNPYRFYNSHPFNEIRWEFPIVPMTAGGDIDISTNINDMNLTVKSVIGTVIIEGTNEDETPYSYVKNVEMSDISDIEASDLSLYTISGPDNFTATYYITNPYNVDVIVNWEQNNGNTGNIIAKSNNNTYFEIPATKPNTSIRASVNGKLLTNGILQADNGIAPRTYVPVSNNNGEGMITENRYKATVYIPEDCPINATIKVNVFVQGLDIDTLETRTLSFPQTGQPPVIGKVENTIKELILFNKL